jgi:membrane protease YdiL (CAAX protease family)
VRLRIENLRYGWPAFRFPNCDQEQYKASMTRYPFLAFVAITFLISWAAWLTSSSKQAFMIGALAPGIAAMIVTSANGRLAALQQLFERFLIWRVHLICYAAALLLPAIVSLLATAVHMMFGGDTPDFASPPITSVKLSAFMQGWSPAALILPLFIQHILYGTAIAEELGWRGVALPRLQERYNSLIASLILGCLWAVWVLPFYWKQGGLGGYERTFVLLAIIPGAILSTWIYNISGGSLLLCVIFNIALKVTDLVLASPQAHPLVSVCAYWMAAGLILSFTGVHLGANPRRTVPTTPTADPEPIKESLT